MLEPFSANAFLTMSWAQKWLSSGAAAGDGGAAELLDMFLYTRATVLEHPRLYCAYCTGSTHYCPVHGARESAHRAERKARATLQ